MPRRSGASGASGRVTPALVIFDCDGVLVDSEVISARVLVEVAAEAGVAFDAPYVARHFLGRSFPTVARSIAADFRVTLPPDFEARYRSRLLARFEADLRPTPGIEDLLGRLAVPSCVATSSSPARAARSLALTGLDRFLPRVFTASEVARGKPAPDLFLHAAAMMGAAPASCLVIEDSPPGLLAARAAGMAVVAYAGGSHMRGAGPGTTLGASLGAAFDMAPPLEAFGSWADLARAWPGLVRP